MSYCISSRHRLLGENTKQPLSNFEPPETWKYKQLWGLGPKPSCLYEKKYRLQLKMGNYEDKFAFSFFSFSLKQEGKCYCLKFRTCL